MTNYLKSSLQQVAVSLAICSFTFSWISPSLAHEYVGASRQVILADDFEVVETGKLIRATVGTWRGETLLGAIVESDDLPGAPHKKAPSGLSSIAGLHGGVR